MLPPPAHVTYPDRVRLRLKFDAERLKNDLCRLCDAEWITHFVKQNYVGDWDVLPLRAQANATHPIMMIYSNPNAETFEDTVLLRRTPYFCQVLAAFECPLQAVRLMRLTPGSAIKTHRDFDLAFEQGAARIHIPITTNPGVEFLLNGIPVPMRPGNVWYLRLSDPHSVANNGNSDRVHLVIDALANPWLGGQLDHAEG